MKILDHKDAINRRQDEELIIVETAIYRVSCLNRTVLGLLHKIPRQKMLRFQSNMAFAQL
ncbi:MAG: hypothetical protein V7L23_08470 [Nostoc sp.]|uniref:hypothetical protein n=1 Tax=Nostoc sp. TaxID=1180 RepID=UPI002FF0E354